jgi:putative two-component system response regulator
MIPANEKATIMLVDDTPANLKLLEQLLKKEGCRVMQFPNGRTALGALARKQPDLILLDIMMPEMDGFEVCARLKENEATRDIPVIFISALADTEHKIRAFTEGGVDYVTKPFQEEEILARVKTHLSLRQMQQELRKHNLYLEELVREKVREISESQLSTIHAVSKLAEYRDDETGRHIERTRLFCRMLAEVLAEKSRYSGSINKTFIENIYHAAPLHDIGKVGIPDSILLKPGKLDTEEFEIIKTHTTIGAMTLQQVRNKYPQNAFVNMGIALTRSHHEKWDGSGYPDGLSGENIPLSARIMAVADVYDALRSERPYKKAFSHEKSCGIIREGNGSHFDPDIVAAFNSIHLELAQVREQIKGHDIMSPSE